MARSTITTKRRFEILARDGHRCRYCGSAHELQIDHVVPVVAGGSNDPTNLVAACRICNNGKGAHIIDGTGIPDIDAELLFLEHLTNVGATIAAMIRAADAGDAEIIADVLRMRIDQAVKGRTL